VRGVWRECEVAIQKMSERRDTGVERRKRESGPPRKEGKERRLIGKGSHSTRGPYREGKRECPSGEEVAEAGLIEEKERRGHLALRRLESIDVQSDEGERVACQATDRSVG
jgi:hypothetical protein